MVQIINLLTTRRFLPLFVTQFLGAFNDNVFKNALVILVLYRIAAATGDNGQILVTLAGALFILPFFLFSATAGQLADKYEKARLILMVKFAEIPVMAAAAYGFFTSDTWFLMAVLFAMGSQSTFFGPLKYSILPDHLGEGELVGGNALIEAGTFLAILGGTILGGVLILAENGVALTSALVVATAVGGFAASLFIPAAGTAAPDLKVDPNIARETVSIIRHAKHSRPVFLAILGISWFWAVGATLLSQFPAFAKDVLKGDEFIVTILLVVFSVGVGAGSLLSSRLLKGEISARYVPFAAIGITLFGLDLYFASRQPASGVDLLGPAAFLSTPANWRILGDLFLIAVCGGVFSIPLYAIVQARSDVAHRSRTIAANNVVNALFMVASALVTMGMLTLGFSVPEVFLATALANAAVALYICRLLPDEMLRAALQAVFRALYRVEVKGLENVAKAGPRAVIVPNHLSFLDAPILAAFLPGRPSYAIDTHIARRWWVRPALWLVDAVTVDPTNPFAAKTMAKAVREGRHLVIFPEGRITTTGGLMKVYEGPGLIADKADATILPVRIDGAQFTPFSRMQGKLRLRWFPKITVTVLPPRKLELPVDLKGRQRRQAMGRWLQDLMSGVAAQTFNADRSLFEALLDARALYGAPTPVVTDADRQPASYDRLTLGSFVLGHALAARTAPGEHVGLMLPNSVGAAVTFFALQATGRVPAMINFSSGADSVRSAVAAAGIRTVLTSRRFIELGRLDKLAASLAEVADLVHLEDVRHEIGLFGKLRGLVARAFPRRFMAPVKPEDPAVILFTSGSEGTPKGVVLSHRNILSNIGQISAVIDFNATDKVMNALPMFHSFGLTGGTILPILSGIKTFLYPSPLHYRIIPELVYGENSTILFGTDTFLAGYARVAHPYDFYSLRLCVAGAERVREETRRTWMDKFGVRILEGYGATETAPVLAVNTPMLFKAGTVGRFLPLIEHRLEPVPGIEEGGRLHVKGPNVALGYLKADRPGVLQPFGDEYDTGDIVAVDAQGFVRIQGRAKRFAKVAGEMVSLNAAEALASELWPDAGHAVVAIPDLRKGEQLVLVTTQAQADRAMLMAHAQRKGVAELVVPRTVQVVSRLPLLGTGKTDYAAVQKLVAEMSVA